MANRPAAPTSVSRSTGTIIDIASTKMQSCSDSSENREGTDKNTIPILGSSCSLKRKRPPKIEIPNVLREIVVGKEPSLRECAPQENAVCSSGYGVGVYSLKGKKKFMEDAHKIVTCSFNKKGFFGVYDGHGGSKAAEFVAEHLHSNIYEMLKNSSGNAPKEEYIKAGYLKTDEDFLKQGLGSGVCCVTALIEDKDIVISNLGDCRAVLCRGGAAEALTKDHKAGLEDERRRIEDKGGFVQHHRGAWRVHGILAVSRSIGDAHLKDWVPAEPDTKIISLTKDMEYLVLASDGLWEEVGNQEAAEIVARSCSREEKAISKESTDEYGRINLSPSPKLRRVSLKSKRTGQFPGSKRTVENWNTSEASFSSENDSPRSKAQRISLSSQANMKSTHPSHENSISGTKPACSRLVAACKELVNLAVKRGSLDDITVMVIDLNSFRN
ncbi:probable protein phosphatase 2C 14 [Coffea arabica]|uniref:protein-serine/threonine phosphatase n=1 Tax=Coffea arabica TaxID=13443 RepID=A0ABM4W2P2_COFAR